MEAGRELDALVAEKVMGLPPAELGGECPDCGSETRIGIDRAWCYGCHEWKYSPYKEYSTDIAAAWQIMVHFHDECRDVRISSTIGGWTCWIEVGYLHAPAIQYANGPDSAPLAICLAALKAVGVNVETELEDSKCKN